MSCNIHVKNSWWVVTIHVNNLSWVVNIYINISLCVVNGYGFESLTWLNTIFVTWHFFGMQQQLIPEFTRLFINIFLINIKYDFMQCIHLFQLNYKLNRMLENWYYQKSSSFLTSWKDTVLYFVVLQRSVLLFQRSGFMQWC